jgi:hypothetical protein
VEVRLELLLCDRRPLRPTPELELAETLDRAQVAQLRSNLLRDMYRAIPYIFTMFFSFLDCINENIYRTRSLEKESAGYCSTGIIPSSTCSRHD